MVASSTARMRVARSTKGVRGSVSRAEHPGGTDYSGPRTSRLQDLVVAGRILQRGVLVYEVPLSDIHGTSFVSDSRPCR